MNTATQAPIYTTKRCKRHKPKSEKLGYLEWHFWADMMYEQGKTQTQCLKCGRWYFKSEM